MLHGLYWLCANLSGDRPLVLTVDDAHWADAPSLRFLAFLLPRLEELSLALVVATRPEAEGAAAPLLALLLADPLARVLRPAPLSARAVGRLVEEGLGRAPDPDFAAACRRTTGGVPFLVRELVEALREEGVAPTAAEARRVEALGARTVGRAMLVRLSRLPAVAVRLAQAVAVLETAELAQAADLAGVDADAAAAAADLLVAASILGPRRPLAFAHPIVRAGILEEVPPAERMRAHRRAAELLAVREDSGERVAEHLLATEPAGDAWTVARLTDAARDAARRGAPESAASYLRRVLAEPPAPGARARILLELGVAEATAGQPEGEAHLREALAGGGRRRRAPRRRARPGPCPRPPRADRPGDRGHRPGRRAAGRQPRPRARAARVDGHRRRDARRRDGAAPGLAHARHAPRRRPRARPARGPGGRGARRPPCQRAGADLHRARPARARRRPADRP